MFGFLKKLFGMDRDTLKEAGVQIEQAPYKLEIDTRKDNDDYHDAPAWLTDNDPKTAGPSSVAPNATASQIQVVEEVKVAVKEKKPAAMSAPKKPTPAKKPTAPKKPAPPRPEGAPKRGRKPKAKA